MKHKSLTLSIVIPVFNEQDYLANCLDSIAAQTEMPDEVIVINNNSTDETVEIARRYAFVKVLHETQQHQAFAQKTGFDYASSDILGRIDGDTILPRNWVAKVKQTFSADEKLDALTSSGVPYDFYLQNFARLVFRGYNILASLIARKQILWGANTAIRKDAWRKISGRVMQRADIWEDYDTAFCLEGKVKFIKGLNINTSFRAIRKPFHKQLEYQFRAVRTFYYHKSVLQAVLLAVVWSTMPLFYPVSLLDDFLYRNLRLEKPAGLIELLD